MTIPLITGPFNESMTQINTMINQINAALAGPPPSGATTLAALTDVLVNQSIGVNNMLLIGSPVFTGSGNQNTGFGISALSSLTTGSSNTGLGLNAGAVIDTGFNNTSIGLNSLGNLTNGSENVQIGLSPGGGTLTTGSNNTLLGTSTDVTGAAAMNQIAVGYQAVAPADNTAQIGNASITDVYFGAGTAKLHADGSFLTNLPAGGATTFAALTDVLVSGGPNSNMFATGVLPAAIVQSADQGDTAFGQQALSNVTTGSHNSAFGDSALHSVNTGTNNTAVGYSSLVNSNGAASINNTALGTNAGYSVSIGDQNTLIGSGTDVSVGGAHNQTAIGYGAIGYADNTVQIGNTSLVSVTLGDPTTSVLYASIGHFGSVVTAHGGVTTDSTNLWTLGAHTTGALAQAGSVAITISGVSYKLLTA